MDMNELIQYFTQRAEYEFLELLEDVILPEHLNEIGCCNHNAAVCRPL